MQQTLLTVRLDDLHGTEEHQAHDLAMIQVFNIRVKLMLPLELIPAFLYDEVVPLQLDHLPLDYFFFDGVLAH